MGYYSLHQYDNNYSSIRVIANEFTKIQPYSIDANGKQVDSVVIDKLYHPNQKMSAARFRQTLAIMQLVHPRVYLLVWHSKGKQVFPGGDINSQNIAGFTFLEGVSEIVTDNKVSYQVGQKQWTDKEVIVLGGLNPDNLSEGYSPSMAVRKWSRLDDYIADFQLGFFENGAVPQGQFLITAATSTEFNDIVNYLEKSHKGAGKNNNVTYAHQSIDQNTGKVGQAQITWIPYNTSNKEMELSSLFDQVSQKLDSAFGVPASIRGVNESNTYASVRVDEVILSKYVVDPFSMLTWSDFTHSMSYITGGLGVAITYNYEIPNIAEEDKLVAETKSIELGMIQTAIAAGFSLDSAVDALKLSNAYKNLKTGASTATTIDNDKPEVDEGNEVANSPDPRDTKHLHSPDCGHEVANGKDPKALIDNKRIKPENRDRYESTLEGIAQTLMFKQIERAIRTVKAVGDPTEKDLETFTDDFTKAVVAVMVAEGAIEYQAGVQVLINAGFSADEATGYILSQTTIDSYRAYLLNVAQSYSDDTAVAIRQVLDYANINELSRAETQNALRNILDTDDYRIKRLARTEVNHAQGIAANDSIAQIQESTNIKINKIWNIRDSTACEYCKSLNGKVIGIDESFVPYGEELTGEGVKPRLNDFIDIKTTNAHPNCRCYPTYEPAGPLKAVKKELHCVKCDRFLGETSGTKAVDKIKCGNSSCKALEVPIIKEIQQ